MRSIRQLIAAHRALVLADETLFDELGNPVGDGQDESLRAVIVAFRDLLAAPCHDLADVHAKVDYLLNGTIGDRAPNVWGVTGEDGDETFAEDGALMSFIRSLAPQPRVNAAPLVHNAFAASLAMFAPLPLF